MGGDGLLILGRDGRALRDFASVLGGSLEALPARADDAALEAWRERIGRGAPCPRIVVAIWNEALRPEELLQLTPESWLLRAETPLLDWSLALGAASARCADGGAIVAVADAPGALDAAGWVPESGLAEAVHALVRSLAQSEGARGVRVNSVATPARIHGAAKLREAPLPTYPGRLELEVAGAVRLLLSPQATGLTGCSLSADCGRSW
jgi:NAD(P)-dependent dehydrogenase (short-subunit alcohol dehydrogenase family)